MTSLEGYPRKVTTINDGVVVSESMLDLTWSDIRTERDRMLKLTDLWYLKDRWDQLSTTDKGKLNTYRNTLRDLPQTYSDANDAADNFPTEVTI